MAHAPPDSVLRATTIALWAAAAATVAAAVWLPYRLPVPDARDGHAHAAPTTTGTGSAVSFDDLLDVNLRRPLVDAPATAPVAPATAVAMGPGLRLAGVMIEPGHSYAVLVTATGTTEVRSVGERAGGAEVLAIGPSTVTVRVGGQNVTLALPPQKSDLIGNQARGTGFQPVK
jgi:hypothetical protein